MRLREFDCLVSLARLWTVENRECFVNHTFFTFFFWKIIEIFHVFSHEVRFIFSFLIKYSLIETSGK